MRLPSLRLPFLTALRCGAFLVLLAPPARASIVELPILTGVWRTVPGTVMAGEHVGFSYTRNRQADGVERSSILLRDPTGTARIAMKDHQTNASLAIPTRADWPKGRYVVEQISVDGDLGSTTFYRDGRVTGWAQKVGPTPQFPSSHALGFEVLDFVLVDNAGGTAVGGPLPGDTRWTPAGSPYRLTGHVLVPAGATLTIEPGTRVVGSTEIIDVAGTFVAEGSAANPVVLSNVVVRASGGGSYAIRLAHAHVFGGAISPTTLTEVRGTVVIRDSVLVELGQRMQLRFPTTEAVLERNLLYHCMGIDIGTGNGSSAGVTIRHNHFFEPHLGPTNLIADNDGVIVAFAQSGGPITVTQNTFTVLDSGVALKIPVGATASIAAAQNFFDVGVVPVALTANKGAAGSSISIDPMASTPDPLTPPAPVAPTLIVQPVSQTMGSADGTTLSVRATGSGVLSYQWYRDGMAVAGATSPDLALPAPAAPATYTVKVANFAGTTTSLPATLAVSDTGSPLTSWLSNVSVRTGLQAGQSPLLVGFATNGPKSILVRAAGPALAPYGVPTPLADPTLTLYAAADREPLAANDDWAPALATTFEKMGAFPFAAGSRDAALLQTIGGMATAHASGGTGAGIVLVEAYDANPEVSAIRLVNVSARNHVGAGSEVLITGFVLQGTGTKRLLIRGVGPKLADYGVSGVLADPRLEVYNAAGVAIAANDNWDASLASTFATAGAFPLTPGSKDAALVVTLPASASYSVQLSGADGGTGQALVEVYEVP